MTIISLSGYASAGKDATAKFLIQDHGFVRFAFADILREAAERINPGVEIDGSLAPLDRVLRVYGGWDTAKAFPSVRRLLQVLGTEVGRDLIDPDCWVKATFRKIDAHWSDRIVITDCRFLNEAKAVQSQRGQCWRVARPGVGAVNGHVSESSLDGFLFDYTIDNDGSLVDLREATAMAVEERHLS